VISISSEDGSLMGMPLPCESASRLTQARKSDFHLPACYSLFRARLTTTRT
jgi:hypothetical protein